MYNPTEVENLTHNAQTAFNKGNYSEAARIYQQVVDALDPASLPALNAEARNYLSVALLKNGRAQAAFDQAAGTDLIFSDLQDYDKQAIALGNQAAALAALNRNDEALKKYQASSALLKQSGNSEMRSYVLREISVLQMKGGKQVDSLFTMDAALESKKKLNWRESVIKGLMQIVHRLMRSS